MENVRFHFSNVHFKNATTNDSKSKTMQRLAQPFSVENLISLITQGLTIQPAVFDYRKGNGCIGQQVFMFRVLHSTLSPKESIMILNEKSVPVIGGYTSFDNKSYVLILICEREVTDSFERRFIIQYINRLLLQEDYCLSDDELFFGTNKMFNIRNLEARFKVENIVNLDNLASCFSCVNNFSKNYIAMLQRDGEKL